MKENERTEEAMEVLRERQVADPCTQMNTETQLTKELEIPIEQLVREGIVKRSGETIHVNPAGKNETAWATRRHRLSERLFRDIIETDREEMDEAACQAEHIVKKGIEEKIYRLLGRPKTRPHGKPISPGDSCRKARETKETFVTPLTGLKRGETGTIVYIKAGELRKLQKLMAMGVLPGNVIVLDENFPSFVFSVGYSQYAVDADMAAAIIVKKG